MAKQRIIEIPFETIVVDKNFNARTTYDEERIDHLKDSILNNGLLHPIGVSPASTNNVEGKQIGTNKYHLVYGYRRYLAICKIREEVEGAYSNIYVVINEGTVDELRERNFKENIERENLSPYEKAERVKMMVHAGLEQREIAARLGRPQAWVSNYYRAATKAALATRNAFKNGELTMEQVLCIIDLPEEAQADIVTEVVEADTRSEARSIAKKASKEKGTRRKYANKGRPTAKNLTQAVAEASFEAFNASSAKEKTSFFNGVAAGLKVALGDIEFNSLHSTEEYGDLDYGKAPQENDAAKK